MRKELDVLANLFDCLSNLLVGVLLELVSLLVPLLQGATAGLIGLLDSLVSLLLCLGRILDDSLACGLRVVFGSG